MGKDPGITIRHRAGCRTNSGGKRCNCSPAYRAEIFDRRSGKRIYKSFPTTAAAKAWRADAMREVRLGLRKGPSGITLRQAAEEWMAGAKDGSVRARGGTRYKPSTLSGYEASLRDRVLPELGGLRLEDVTRTVVQGFADKHLKDGLSPSTVRNALMPLRAVFRRFVKRGVVALNPTENLDLPTAETVRDRIAPPTEVLRLLDVLDERDRALLGTAIYAGLRAGELQALDWDHIDFTVGVIRVERAWDPKNRVFVEPKSRAGRRRVPIVPAVRTMLMEHKLRTGGDGLVWQTRRGTPFNTSALRSRMFKAWELAGMRPIGLHEARHTYASLMIAAGVNGKALSTYMGHSNIGITFDRYGHLMPGNEEEAAGLLHAYLERSERAPNHATIA